MKIVTTITLLLMSTQLAGRAVFPPPHKAKVSEHSQIVLGALWESSGHPPYEYTPVTPDKNLDTRKKQVAPVPAPAPAPTPVPKKLSKGEQYIREALKKNREKLKQVMSEKKSAAPSGDKGSLTEQYLRGLNQMKRKTQQTYSDWQKQRDETYSHWRQMRREFLKNLPQYKEALYSFEAGIEIPFKKLNKPLSRAPEGDYHIIPGALDVPVKDQGRRPTCASFSAVRAIETILKGNDIEQDLSEQYFYWASKPECQRFPCSKRGSWVVRAFNHSKESPQPDIPLEENCPYIKRILSGNETQVPLREECGQGYAQVQSFDRLETTDEIVKAIQSNRPVIGGFRLSPNFYETQGLITLEDSHKNGETDSHAKGHALLIVGTMKLPAKMHSREGQICFIVANSWGEGWGKGGFGCLTEAWLRKYRIRNAFISLNGIRI